MLATAPSVVSTVLNGLVPAGLRNCRSLATSGRCGPVRPSVLMNSATPVIFPRPSAKFRPPSAPKR